MFLALRRHRVTQGPCLLRQPLDRRRSSLRPAFLTTDVADRFEVGEQFVEEGEQFRQHWLIVGVTSRDLADPPGTSATDETR